MRMKMKPSIFSPPSSPPPSDPPWRWWRRNTFITDIHHHDHQAPMSSSRRTKLLSSSLCCSWLCFVVLLESFSLSVTIKCDMDTGHQRYRQVSLVAKGTLNSSSNSYHSPLLPSLQPSLMMTKRSKRVWRSIRNSGVGVDDLSNIASKLNNDHKSKSAYYYSRHHHQQHQHRQSQQQPHQKHHQLFNVKSSLSINVHNNGGEKFRELITANHIEDWIALEYNDSDATQIKTVIDFANNLQLFRVTRLGEQDLNEPKVQTYCFVITLPPNEYISSDAMSKLTQRNPDAIRQAELDHGTTVYDMTLQVSLETLPNEVEVNVDREQQQQELAADSLLTPHLQRLCGGGINADGYNWPKIFASEVDLRQWKSSFGIRNYQNLSILLSPLVQPNASNASAAPPLSSSSSTSSSSNSSRPRCGDLLRPIYHNITASISTPPLMFNTKSAAASLLLQQSRGQLCTCSLPILIPFYPCDIKYCEQSKVDKNGSGGGGSDSAADSLNNDQPPPVEKVRCGIKTCRKLFDFRFTVTNRLYCLRDFDPTIDSIEDRDQSLPVAVVAEEKKEVNAEQDVDAQVDGQQSHELEAEAAGGGAGDASNNDRQQQQTDDEHEDSALEQPQHQQQAPAIVEQLNQNQNIPIAQLAE